VKHHRLRQRDDRLTRAVALQFILNVNCSSKTGTGLTVCGKKKFRHPERSEGSAFLLNFQETGDSSGKPRPSE
jgi:hypothetical protein